MENSEFTTYVIHEMKHIYICTNAEWNRMRERERIKKLEVNQELLLSGSFDEMDRTANFFAEKWSYKIWRTNEVENYLTMELPHMVKLLFHVPVQIRYEDLDYVLNYSGITKL